MEDDMILLIVVTHNLFDRSIDFFCQEDVLSKEFLLFLRHGKPVSLRLNTILDFIQLNLKSLHLAN
jgi:hypothetical protein